MGRRHTYISIFVLCVLGIGIYLMNAYDSILFAIASLVVAVGYLAWTVTRLVRNVRALRTTKNMDVVDRYIQRRQDKPYYASMLAILDGNFDAARNIAKRVHNPLAARVLELVILAKQEKYDEVLALLPSIKNKSFNHEMRAKIAIVRQDWGTYYEHMQHIKRHVSRLTLQADAAFVRGEMEEAKRFGDEAIEKSRGIYRFILLRELELSELNPNRKTYF